MLAHLSRLLFPQQGFAKLCLAGAGRGPRHCRRIDASASAVLLMEPGVGAGGVGPQPHLHKLGTGQTEPKWAKVGRQNRRGASQGRSWEDQSDRSPPAPPPPTPPPSLLPLTPGVSALVPLSRCQRAWRKILGGLPSRGPRNPEARAGALSSCLSAGPVGFGQGRMQGPEASKQAVSGPWVENPEQAGRRGLWRWSQHLSALVGQEEGGVRLWL